MCVLLYFFTYVSFHDVLFILSIESVFVARPIRILMNQTNPNF